MKRKQLMTEFLLIILLTITCGCSSQGIITESQAINAVKDFEANQNLQLKIDDYEEADDGYSSTGKSNTYYASAITTPDPRFRWEVNAITGEVFQVAYLSRIPTNKNDIPYGIYTQSQCRQIALDFIHDKYTDFDNMGFQLIEELWNKTGWEFAWSQINAYGAYCNNNIDVCVNVDTGLIQRYSSCRYPVFNAQQPPSISAQQSIALAAQAAGISNLTSNDTPLLYANPNTLYWRIGVVGINGDDDIVDVSVELDAYSGSIINIDAPSIESFAPIPNRAKSKKNMTLKSINSKCKSKVGRKIATTTSKMKSQMSKKKTKTPIKPLIYKVTTKHKKE